MTLRAYGFAVLLATTGAVQAGGPTVVQDDPAPSVPAPVAAHDWSGGYVGLGYSHISGDMVYSSGPTVFEFESSSAPSIFAGYLLQRGTLVFGGELAYTNGDGSTLVGFPAEGITDIFDLKGRFGVAANRTLFYGVLGFSTVDYNEGAAENGSSGFSYGLGLDFAASDRIVAGVEYLARKTDGDTFTPGLTRDLDINTVSLRVGLSF
jgi:opacity protein-like surface antigen